MFARSIAWSVFAALIAAACQSAPHTAATDASSSTTQAIVESIAKRHSNLTRLTVHKVPEGAANMVAVASTEPAKINRPSDPEDLNAVAKGVAVVLEERDSLDVTVPICKQDYRFTAAAGVTFRFEPGMNKEMLIELANAIGKELESRMALVKAK